MSNSMSFSCIAALLQMDLSIHPNDSLSKLKSVMDNGSNTQKVFSDDASDPNVNITIVFGEDSLNLPQKVCTLLNSITCILHTY